jgi:hypothetical protein
MAIFQKILSRVRKNSTGTVFARSRLNLIEGANVTLTVADDSANDEIDVTIASTGGGGGVSSIAKNGSSALTGAVTLSQGSNVTLTQSGQDIAVAASIGVASVAKSGSSALTGAVTLSQGTNVTLTQSGQDIAIAATGTGVSASDLGSTTDATKGASLIGARQTNLAGTAYVTGTVAQTLAQVLSEGPLSVRRFGAVGDGVANDQPAIQAAVNALPVTGGDLYFPPGTYKVNSTVALPTALPGGTPIQTLYTLRGPGAKLITTAAIDIMSQSLPANNTAAEARTAIHFNVNGLTFLGTSNNSQRGLVLAANYGNVIENCVFQELGTGLELLFTMMSTVRSCFFEWNTQHGFRTRAGTTLWTGATGSNSCPNHTAVVNCHAGCVTGSLTGFLFEDASGCVFQDSIVEGGSPVNGVSYDSRGTGTSHTFFIRNAHIECNPAPSNAMIKLVAVNQVDINGVFIQTAGTVIDATGSNDQGLIYVQGIPNWPTGSLFKMTSGEAKWWFYGGVGAYGDKDVLDPAYWVSGNTPFYGYAHRSLGAEDSPLYGPYPVQQSTRLGQKGTITTVT